MAEELVGKLYGVTPVTVSQDPLIVGDTAMVIARYDGQQCTLTMVRHPTANKYGWVAQDIRCSKSAAMPLASIDISISDTDRAFFTRTYKR